MQKVIQKVIAAEAEAKQLVLAAKAAAGQLLTAARTRADQLVEQARSESRAQAANILDAAERQATQERAERLKLAAAEINTGVCLNEARVRQAVEATVRHVRGSG